MLHSFAMNCNTLHHLEHTVSTRRKKSRIAQIAYILQIHQFRQGNAERSGEFFLGDDRDGIRPRSFQILQIPRMDASFTRQLFLRESVLPPKSLELFAELDAYVGLHT
jgi:hypothetical protein